MVIALLGVAGFTTAEAGAVSPVRAKIGFCEAVAYPDFDGGALGYQHGAGNVPSRRTSGFSWGVYAHKDDNVTDAAVRQQVLAATHRIEICLLRAGTISCPADGKNGAAPDLVPPWVLYDEQSPAGSGTLLTAQSLSDSLRNEGDSNVSTDIFGVLGPGISTVPELDWADPANQGRYMVLVVNRGYPDGEDPVAFTATGNSLLAPPPVAQGGYCPVYAFGQTSPQGRYRIFSTPAGSSPFTPGKQVLGVRSGATIPSVLDPCVGGFNYGDINFCTPVPTLAFLPTLSEKVGGWHDQITPQEIRPKLPAWANSDDEHGTCEEQVKVGGYCPSVVYSGGANINHGVSNGVFLESSLSDAFFTPLRANGLVSLLSHEEGHFFQDHFLRDALLTGGVADPGLVAALHQGAVAESVPAAIQNHACYDNYSGVTGKLCVSAGMLDQTSFGADSQNWFLAPAVNPLAIPYTGSIVWRYWAEQFASTNLKAHPLKDSPVAKSIHPSNHSLPLGNKVRRSDEGLDLVARIVQRMAFKPVDPMFAPGGTVDSLLKEYVGRSFENMMVDFHTAVLLKDYKEIPNDDRWFFEWIGDFNAGVAVNPIDASLPTPVPQMLRDLKPFGVHSPAELKYRSVDQSHRVARLVDAYDTAGAALTLKPFGPNFSAASFNPEPLDSYGASYLTAFASENPGANPAFSLSIKITPKGGAGLATRVFSIDASGNPSLACEITSALLPGVQDVCKCDPEGPCQFTVPITTSVREVVVAVSNPHDTQASFLYAIGSVTPALRLTDPVTSHPASIGNKTNRKPVLAKFALRGANGDGVSVAKNSLRFSVCPASLPPSPCVLPDSAVSVTQLGSGQYWAALTMPDWVYDDPSQLRDLSIEATTGGTSVKSSEGTGALVIENTPRKTVMQVVLDRSGSMNDFGGSKLAAAKVATKLVAQNLLDTDELGLVTFNNDAQSPLRLLGVKAVDDTPNHCLIPAGADRATWGLSSTPEQPDPRGDFASVVDALVAVAGTSIGDGALEAQSNLISKGYDKVHADGSDPNLAMLVITDGLNTENFKPDRYSTYEPYGSLTDSPDGIDDVDPCDNGPWTAGTSAKMSLPGRKGAGVLIPTVSTLAIGQDAFGPPLQILSDQGGGIFSFADALPDVAFKKRTTKNFVDAVLQGLHRMTGHQRGGTYKIEPGTPMPIFPVEARARDLVVSVVSLGGALDSLRLVGPGGVVVAPTRQSDDSVVFRIDTPQQGSWTFVNQTPVTANFVLEAYAEAAFRSPVVLQGYADVVDPIPVPIDNNSGAPFDAGRWVGKSVHLAAIVTDGHPQPDTRVTAHVVAPGGKESDVVLFDDGHHGDGAPGDGFFAARFLDTGTSGNYSVTYTAVGLSVVTQDNFHHEESLAFELHDAPDTDGDGLPDWWENQNGTRTDSADADLDPDADGLTNAQEFQLHTRPLQADTDGGGEADGSEVSKGLDPRNPADDQAKKVETRVLPGNGKVRISFRLDPLKPVTPQIRRSAQRNGPYELLPVRRAGDTTPPGAALSDTTQATLLAQDTATAACYPLASSPGLYECEAANNTPFCYQQRLTGQDGTTDWSDPACVTASTDPYPPRIESFSLATSDPSTRSRQVTLRLNATDDPGGHVIDPLVDEATAPQGVVAVLLSTSPSFAGASWQSYSPELSFWLPDAAQSTIFAKVMDAAGNESNVAVRSILIRAKTPLDEALHLEETALDQLQKGNWADARTNIKNSLPKLKTSIQHLQKSVTCTKPDATDLKLLEGLLVVALRKDEALLLANKLTGKLAIKALTAALQKEREVATLAEQKGRSL
jgi:hypothetical protein